MATMTHSAPVFGVTTLVDQEQFQDLVQRSHSLIQKILLSISDVHSSSIHIKTLKLNSTENRKMEIMASNIGIPNAPVLTVVSENFPLETSLRHMSEGLQLHRGLLNFVLPKLNNNVKMAELSNDIGDLDLQIHKMLKLIQNTAVPTPTLEPVVLRLSGEYDIQVAAHLTLVNLSNFGQDVVVSLHSMELSEEEEIDS
uniref:Colony stimulating factor 3 (granulocyte) a n=2 Tax=Periophthalmus magnuspinnatus TaxID=409849 RepID=A0A3B3ZKH9_9GOBI